MDTAIHDRRADHSSQQLYAVSKHLDADSTAVVAPDVASGLRSVRCCASDAVERGGQAWCTADIRIVEHLTATATHNVRAHVFNVMHSDV